MTAYTFPPACTRCGAPLLFDEERCRCGGRSQYMEETAAEPRRAALTVADALRILEARREPPGARDAA